MGRANPLPDGHLWQHLIDEVSGEIGHATAEARGASFTGEAHDHLVAALLARNMNQQGLDPVRGMAGAHEMVGRRIIVDMADCTELEGVEVRFEVEVQDASGVTVQDDRTVTGTNAPINRCS